MTEERGKQVKLREVTAYGITAELDNKVTVSINFNNGEIHLHFSGTELPLKIREADIGGKHVELANYVTIQYKARNNGRV
jgi:hypothetical protein